MSDLETLKALCDEATQKYKGASPSDMADVYYRVSIRLLSKLQQQARELEEADEALKVYGEHRAYCELGYTERSKCSCGLESALARQALRAESSEAKKEE